MISLGVTLGVTLSGHPSLLQEGFAHVVENEAEWKAEFGRDVLEGLLDHPDAGTPLAL